MTGSSRATSPPSYSRRIGYVSSAMLTNVGLAIFLAFAQHPLYAPYAQLAHRPGGITALADQQIGAGVMWAAGDLPFAIALALLVQHWRRRRPRRPASTSWSRARSIAAGQHAQASRRHRWHRRPHGLLKPPRQPDRRRAGMPSGGKAHRDHPAAGPADPGVGKLTPEVSAG